LSPFDYLKVVFSEAPKVDIHNDSDALERLTPWNAPLGYRTTVGKSPMLCLLGMIIDYAA